MKKELIEQCNKWHDRDEHQRIIGVIEKIPERERDYETILMLCRALNNAEKYEEAYRALLSVKSFGETDYHWHFRMGYACYHLQRYDDAVSSFDFVTKALPNEPEAWEYLSWCYEKIGRPDLVRKAEKRLDELLEDEDDEFEPQLYTEAELNAVEAHIEKYFGECTNVFHEISSPDLHIDILIIEPTKERNYYVLVTTGMGAHSMSVPAELEGLGFDHAELLIKLPPDWNLGGSDEDDYWPVRWLKILARLPLNEDSWLGWGHTVPAGGFLCDSTALNGVILCEPMGFDDGAFSCMLPDDEILHFYQIMPLYEEEMQYKLDGGAEKLFACFERMGISDIVDMNRVNACAELSEKNFAIKTDSIRTLLPDWAEVDGCIATDRIMLDGKKVGYMYREKPVNEDNDSGWRFFAGDEDAAYLENSENSGVYSLNTVCNYDEEIIPLLTLPAGTKCVRNKRGKLVKLKKR